MKTSLILVLSLAAAQLVWAQESVTLEQAQKSARKVNEAAGTVSDAAVKIDPDVEKPQAIKGGGGGLMIIPDKALNAAVIGDAAQTPVPVGQLWSYKIAVAADGRVVASDKLRIISVTDGEKSGDVQLYLLGATKNDKGALELAVFGKAQEPIVRVPLEKTSAATAKFPIELAARKNDETSGTLTLNVLGRYKADILMVKAQE